MDTTNLSHFAADRFPWHAPVNDAHGTFILGTPASHVNARSLVLVLLRLVPSGRIFRLLVERRTNAFNASMIR